MHPALHNPGGIKDKDDDRDYLWAEVGFGAAPFDWTKGYDVEAELGFKMPVKDQGSSGSCGGQAWSYQSAVLEALATHTFEERSAKFIYSQTFVLPDGGSMGRDNAQLVVDQGDAKESVLTSYINGQPPTEAFMRRKEDITPAIQADAKLNRELAYANVAPDINMFAQAMRENHGLVLGLDGEDNGTWLSAFPKPPSSRKWGHWLYAGKAKMIDGKKYIGVLNSWGVDVGDHGWQWIGEDYFNSGHIWLGWTHTYNSTPVDSTFHYHFASEMGFGAIGADVVALQTGLQLKGFFPQNVQCSGLFGNITVSSVKKFQAANGIEQVGRVGPKTLAKLNHIFA